MVSPINRVTQVGVPLRGSIFVSAVQTIAAMTKTKRL